MPALAWRNDADGFAFANSWTMDAGERTALAAVAHSVIPAAAAAIGAIVPDPIVTALAGQAANAALALGDLRYGMCGGMAYAAIDYWSAKAPLPRGAHAWDQPTHEAPVASAVRSMIFKRLIDSIVAGGALRRMIEWSLLLNQVPRVLGGGPGALLDRTKHEFAILKSHIDAGQPWPLGLVYTNRDLWDQHQIMAWGYTDNGDGTGSLLVYDSNAPQQIGEAAEPAGTTIPFDFRGPALVATSPSDYGDLLVGFFCTDYSRVAPPAGLAAGYGEFVSWAGDARTWFTGYGVRLAVPGAAELTALGGTAAGVRASPNPAGALASPPRDGALFREHHAAPVYLYEGGAPFWIPDEAWLARFGGWDAVRTVPDGTLAAFVGRKPADGTLLREWSHPKVYRVEGGQRRWVTTPAELGKYGGFAGVRVVPDGALDALPEGPILPPPAPGECGALKTALVAHDAKLAALQASLAGAPTPDEAAQIRDALLAEQTDRAIAQARATVLGCP